MTIDHILAYRADDGRIYIFDESDDFSASYKDGVWVPGRIFEYWETDESFYDITDDGEVLRLASDARTALAKPSDISREPKPKTA